MSPVTPIVSKVEPRCYQCGAPDAAYVNGRGKTKRLLVRGDGPVICRTCVRVCTRLAVIKAIRVNDDGTVNE